MIYIYIYTRIFGRASARPRFSTWSGSSLQTNLTTNKHSLKQTKHANTERAQQDKPASKTHKSAKELLETLVNVVRGELQNLRDTVRRRDRNSFGVEESQVKHVSQTNPNVRGTQCRQNAQTSLQNMRGTVRRRIQSLPNTSHVVLASKIATRVITDPRG